MPRRPIITGFYANFLVSFSCTIQIGLPIGSPCLVPISTVSDEFEALLSEPFACSEVKLTQLRLLVLETK